MAHDDETENKTSQFVDFLMEEGDDLQLVPNGEVDQSAMDFDIDIGAEEEIIELESDAAEVEIASATEVRREFSTDVQSAVDQSEFDADKTDPSFDIRESKMSNEYPTVVTEAKELQEEPLSPSHDYATEITPSEEPNRIATSLEEASKLLEAVDQIDFSEKDADDDLDLSKTFAQEEIVVDEPIQVEAEEQEPISKPVFNFEVAAQAQERENEVQPGDRLKETENLKRAQENIISLENELEKLRQDNQELGAAGEVLKRKLDELSTEKDRLLANRKDAEDRLKEEVQHSQMRMQAKQQEISDLKLKVESLELRLKRDLQMVRVRERELENRLELVKLENAAVLRSKDEHILELKRKMDQSQLEMEQLKDKLRTTLEESDQKQDKIKRTVRTLRLALNMLDEEDASELEKELRKSG